MSNELKEAIKEFGRVVLLAIIPVLIDALSKWQIDYRTLLVIAGLAGLRFIDKYLHERAPEGVSGGLTRF